MPRTRSAAPATESAAASPNGTAEHELDGQGLEKLPDFDEPARARPDTCDTLSPWGTRCTLEVHSGSHSWQGEPAPADDDGGQLDQAELPGTPEPEKTDYDVPFEAQFNGKDLMSAPGLKAIGDRLIAGEQSFDHLRGVNIGWFWRRRGGTQGGNPRYGRIKRPSVYESHFTGGKYIYLLELAADHIRDAKFTPQQISASIFRELCKTDVDPNDHDAYRIVGPDFVGFVREIEVWGAWSPDLREAAARMQQLPLVQVDAEDDESDSDSGDGSMDNEGDEGGESE